MTLRPLRKHEPEGRPGSHSLEPLPSSSQSWEPWMCTESRLMPRRNLVSSPDSRIRWYILKSNPGERGADSRLPALLHFPGMFESSFGILNAGNESLFTLFCLSFPLAWCWPQRGRPTAPTEAGNGHLLPQAPQRPGAIQPLHGCRPTAGLSQGAQ